MCPTPMTSLVYSEIGRTSVPGLKELGPSLRGQRVTLEKQNC